MKRLVRAGLLAAGVSALAGCGSSDRPPAPQPQQSQPQQSQPQRPAAYYNDVHHDYPGPGMTAPNSD